MKEENDENCFSDLILNVQNMTTFRFMEELNGCFRVKHIMYLCLGFPLCRMSPFIVEKALKMTTSSLFPLSALAKYEGYNRSISLPVLK